jgi:ATP-dependent Clp protease protease subunit
MIHQPSHGAQGKISDTRIAVEEGLRLKKMLTQIMVDRTGQTFEQVDKDMDRDRWLSPEQALEYGIIDKIIGSQEDLKS